MPGGVSSPVRAFKSVGGEPVVFDRVKGIISKYNIFVTIVV